MDTFGEGDPNTFLLFVTLLVGVAAVWFVWRRMGRIERPAAALRLASGLSQLLVPGGVGIAFALGAACAYNYVGPLERLHIPSGQVPLVAFLPVSDWGLGAARLEVDYDTATVGSGPIHVIYTAYRIRLGPVEYRCVPPALPQLA